MFWYEISVCWAKWSTWQDDHYKQKTKLSRKHRIFTTWHCAPRLWKWKWSIMPPKPTMMSIKKLARLVCVNRASFFIDVIYISRIPCSSALAAFLFLSKACVDVQCSGRLAVTKYARYRGYSYVAYTPSSIFWRVFFYCISFRLTQVGFQQFFQQTH